MLVSLSLHWPGLAETDLGKDPGLGVMVTESEPLAKAKKSIGEQLAEAKETFQAGEDNAPRSPDETRADDLARARRGLGYVYVELRQLAEAEKKYRQYLMANPNDNRARDELKYAEQLRAKQRK